MARKSKTAVLKRMRERKKMEKAEIKRAEKLERQQAESNGQTVASYDDLAALGLVSTEPEPAPGAEPDEG
jgi:hypothetical protein